MSSRSIQFSFAASRRTFAAVQFATITILLLLSLAAYLIVEYTPHGRLLGFVQLVDVGEEQSLPTYVSALNLLLAAILLLVIWRIAAPDERPSRHYWLPLAIVFALLSVDEAASIHENLGDVLQGRLGSSHPMLITHSWVPYGFGFVLVVGLAYLNFLRQLPRALALRLIASGAVFVGGALGVEFVGAWMLYAGIAVREDLIYKLRRLVEEGAEMYGIVLFNCALFGEIAARGASLCLEAKDRLGRRQRLARDDGRDVARADSVSAKEVVPI